VSPDALAVQALVIRARVLVVAVHFLAGALAPKAGIVQRTWVVIIAGQYVVLELAGAVKTQVVSADVLVIAFAAVAVVGRPGHAALHGQRLAEPLAVAETLTIIRTLLSLRTLAAASPTTIVAALFPVAIGYTLGIQTCINRLYVESGLDFGLLLVTNSQLPDLARAKDLAITRDVCKVSGTGRKRRRLAQTAAQQQRGQREEYDPSHLTRYLVFLDGDPVRPTPPPVRHGCSDGVGLGRVIDVRRSGFVTGLIPVNRLHVDYTAARH